jgi:hypothetical protein
MFLAPPLTCAFWLCRRGDLNPHDLAITRPSIQPRVFGGVGLGVFGQVSEGTPFGGRGLARFK